MGGGGGGGKGPTTVSYGTKEHNGTFPIKVFYFPVIKVEESALELCQNHS